MAAFVSISLGLQCFGLHPFLLLASFVLIPLGIDIGGYFLLSREARWPIGMATTGLSFGLAGGTFATWVFFVLVDPDQQNKLELAIGLGFVALACLAVGGSVITAMILILVDYWQMPIKPNSDQHG
ncbi:MAG TPA: hypothetical protein VMP01_28345 [Pirellulaceae bacterium]|nr:hypothetical protein [Pirellulaceae bacterium]